MAAKSPKAIDLDDHDDTVLFVKFGGVRMTVDARRLKELLTREQTLLDLISKGDAQPAKPETARARQQVVQGAAGNVTHASLSTRVKKVYMFTYESKTLRAAHEQILTDVLDGFDWKIPEHPNTRLDQQLAEMATWAKVPESLKKKIAAFLPRYLSARGLV